VPSSVGCFHAIFACRTPTPLSPISARADAAAMMPRHFSSLLPSPPVSHFFEPLRSSLAAFDTLILFFTMLYAMFSEDAAFDAFHYLRRAAATVRRT
jgi:hypothetical protein